MAEKSLPLPVIAHQKVGFLGEPKPAMAAAIGCWVIARDSFIRYANEGGSVLMEISCPLSRN